MNDLEFIKRLAVHEISSLIECGQYVMRNEFAEEVKPFLELLTMIEGTEQLHRIGDLLGNIDTTLTGINERLPAERLNDAD